MTQLASRWKALGILLGSLGLGLGLRLGLGLGLLDGSRHPARVVQEGLGLGLGLGLGFRAGWL